MRPPRHGAPIDGYVRPQQPWQCGLSDDGPPCPLGPSGHGVCPAGAACHPQREEDRWLCNRSPLRGGPCTNGPGPDGACGVVLRCTPNRALRSRRGRFVAGLFVGALGAACLGLSGSWRNSILAPGALSAHHAHLVDGATSPAGCTQCHGRAGESTAAWLGLGGAPTPTSQSKLCVACHGKTTTAAFATAAHNVPLDDLRADAGDGDVPARWGSARRDAAEPIACAACHREHQGREHDLAAISDAACQACHRERYHSFADGHPDIGLWPYERRTRVVFDHASHAQKHFPAGQREFACAQCHEADATGAHQLTRSYETSCAECHDKALTVSVAQGVALLALPTLDLVALEDAGHAVEPWPADADGDFDGKAPLAALLLASADESAAHAIVALGGDVDFYDVDPENAEQLAATATLAAALRNLVDELGDGGRDSLNQRMNDVLGRDATPAELGALVAQLSPETARAYRDRWFGASADAQPAEPSRQRGAWAHDVATLSLRYYPRGHADPWLKAWFDVLAEAATGPRAAVAEPLLRAAMAPTAPGQCGSCHSVERNPAGRLAMQWRAFAGDDPRLGLTHFSHGAHVLQSQLHDCTACHEMTASAATTTGYASENPRQFVAGFEPLTKADCVACHTPTAAGAGCTQCHRYHGHAVGAGEHNVSP